MCNAARMQSAVSAYLIRSANTYGLKIRSDAHPARSAAVKTDIIIMYFLKFPRNSLICPNPFYQTVVFCDNRDYNVHVVF